MKLLIAGSRTINPTVEFIDGALALFGIDPYIIKELVSGGAKGVDISGEIWATGYNIPVKRFVPAWEILGKRAGYVRNEEMGKYCDAALIIWDGLSRGTRHMLEYMKVSTNKHIYLIEPWSR